MKIDIENYPKQEPVKVFYPDGTLIVETDNEVLFNYIRLQIAENKLEGIYIEFKGEKHTFKPNGKFDVWPKDLFQNATNLLVKMLKTSC